MANQQQLTKFKSCVNSHFQFNSVFVLETNGMFSLGLNAEKRIGYITTCIESEVLDNYRVTKDIMNDTVSVHNNLVTLLPSRIPLHWSKIVIELDSELTEIRSILELTRDNIVDFINNYNLIHLQSWVDYYEKVK